jgi:hypothetical protein
MNSQYERKKYPMSSAVLDRTYAPNQPVYAASLASEGWFLRDNLVYKSAPSYFDRPGKFDTSAVVGIVSEARPASGDDLLDW